MHMNLGAFSCMAYDTFLNDRFLYFLSLFESLQDFPALPFKKLEDAVLYVGHEKRFAGFRIAVPSATEIIEKIISNTIVE